MFTKDNTVFKKKNQLINISFKQISIHLSHPAPFCFNRVFYFSSQLVCVRGKRETAPQ